MASARDATRGRPRKGMPDSPIRTGEAGRPGFAHGHGSVHVARHPRPVAFLVTAVLPVTAAFPCPLPAAADAPGAALGQPAGSRQRLRRPHVPGRAGHGIEWPVGSGSGSATRFGRRVAIGRAGFGLDVSISYATSTEVVYGLQVSAQLGGNHFVADTRDASSTPVRLSGFRTAKGSKHNNRAPRGPGHRRVAGISHRPARRWGR